MALTLTPYEMWYGQDAPPPAVHRLKAGDLNAEFQDGDLRYIRCAGRELIRRIYVAIRDVNWNTIPGVITNLNVDSGADHFHIHFESSHQSVALQFCWQATIKGRPDGTIEYILDGLAESDFRYCRIGFCVLHPIQGIAGSPYRVVTPSGVMSGDLVPWIEPQRIENGYEIPITPSCSSLTVAMPDGIGITTDFEGDLFEMEDQRNWTDGSYKTYCTPLSLGYPHQAQVGQVFHQAVTVRAELPQELRLVPVIEKERVIRLSVSEIPGYPLPRIGFGIPYSIQAPVQREIQLLSRLKPDHLKVELHLQDATWPELLDNAITLAGQISTSLELAIFLSDDSKTVLQALKSRLLSVPLARMIVFQEAEAANGTTSPRWLELVRSVFSDGLPQVKLFGGTNGNFAELNRQPPDISAMDGVSYPINPQVHMPDERSLIEAIEAQGDTVITARRYCGALPISVSSVTLKPPFNQAATEAEAPQETDQLPAAVDPRQMSLFAAAWTVGSLRSLASGGVDSITYFETTGWGGLIESAYGSPLPVKFRSYPGMIFPVYWAFAFLAGHRGVKLIPMTTDHPLLVAGFTVLQPERTLALVSNLQPCTSAVRLEGLPPGRTRVWRLNQDSMPIAASDPDAFLKLSEMLITHAGQAILGLEPYEINFLEIEPD